MIAVRMITAILVLIKAFRQKLSVKRFIWIITSIISCIVTFLVPACHNTASEKLNLEHPSSADKIHIVVPQYFLAQRLDWQPCSHKDSHLYCATMISPRDWFNPTDGQKFLIRVSQEIFNPHDYESIATPDKPLLFSAAGGPGGSGLEIPTKIAERYPQLYRDYRLVSFDGRGIGKSSQLRCIDSQHLEWMLRGDEENHSADYIAAQMAKAHFFVQGCVHKHSDILPYISTTQVVADMDLLRQLLHKPTISFIGSSYGTDVGASYAALFPNHIDRLALDSVVAGFNDLRGDFDMWQTSFYQRFSHDFLPWLAHFDSYYHLGDSVSAVLNSWYKLRRNLVAHPYHYQNFLLDGNFLDFLTSSGMYDHDMFKGLAQMLVDLYHPQSMSLTTQHKIRLLERTGTSEFLSSFFAYSCNDTPWHLDPATATTQLVHRHDQNALAVLPHSLIVGVCAYWPQYQHPVVKITGKNFPPFLMLAARYDPATPYDNTHQLHKNLPHSTLITIDGGDHGQLDPATPCVQNVVLQYFHHLPIQDALCPAHD